MNLTRRALSQEAKTSTGGSLDESRETLLLKDRIKVVAGARGLPA